LLQQLRLVAFDLNDEMVARCLGDLESFFSRVAKSAC
jgi:hypothetical protein